MFCTNCGKENDNVAKFCTGCGKALNKDNLKSSPVQNDVNEKRYVRPENGKKTSLIVASVVLGIIAIWGATFIGYKTFMVEDTDKKQTTVKSTPIKQEETKNENQDIKIYEDNNKGKVSLKGKDDPNGYIIPDSSTRVLTEEELKNLSKEDLALVRNEIFARNGYVFKSSNYGEYFKNKTWYFENPSFEGNETDLNEVEKQNVALIKSLEGR